jgi:hypothetical protein
VVRKNISDRYKKRMEKTRIGIRLLKADYCDWATGTYHKIRDVDQIDPLPLNTTVR